jgi:hypothetical protein
MNEVTKIILYGLFSALVFGPLGYFINDYLSKDNIKIEHVDFIPEMNNFLLPQEDYTLLTKITSVGRYGDINPHLSSLLFRASHKTGFSESTENFKLRYGINKKELDALIESIKDFIKWKTNIDNIRNGYIKRLEGYKDGDSLVDIMIYANDSDIRNACSNSSQNAVSLLLDRFKTMKNYYTSEDTNISRILNNMRNFKQKGTGWMKINVVLLNSGNTDGLFSRDGLLSINGETNIKIKISNNNIIPKVEKRSMLQTDFEIIKGESPPKDIEILNHILINGLLSKGSIEVKDIRGNPIRSRDFTIPVFRDTK